MLDEMRNSESSFIYVNFMTGLTAFFLGIILYAVVKLDISQQINFFEFFNFSIAEYILISGIVFVGFFIHGIRYLFFDYYISLYKMGKDTLFKRFVFYAFRNGTTIEEVLNEQRKDKKAKESNSKSPVREWIQNSAKPEFDIWKYANMINNTQPKANIYRFYYHSEVFQCLDTLFLLMFIFSLLTHEFYFWSGTLPKMNALYLTLYTVAMFVFHRLCKGASKAFDSRFFLEIDVALKYGDTIEKINETEQSAQK